jgi:hypothetical protein
MHSRNPRSRWPIDFTSKSSWKTKGSRGFQQSMTRRYETRCSERIKHKWLKCSDSPQNPYEHPILDQDMRDPEERQDHTKFFEKERDYVLSL